MADQQAGPILDGLGITLGLDDGDLIATALVLAKVVQADGQTTLLIEHSEGMSWLDQLGLVAAADTIMRSSSYRNED